MNATLRGLFPAAFLLAAAGCTLSTPAARALEAREQRLQRTFRAIGESEAMRPARLDRTLRAAGNALALSVVQTEENGRELDAAIRHEFQRFEDNQPKYQRAIGRILAGKPENIERFLIVFLF